MLLPMATDPQRHPISHSRTHFLIGALRLPLSPRDLLLHRRMLLEKISGDVHKSTIVEVVVLAYAINKASACVGLAHMAEDVRTSVQAFIEDGEGGRTGCVTALPLTTL